MKRVVTKTTSKRVARILTAVGTLGAFWAAAGAPWYA